MKLYISVAIEINFITGRYKRNLDERGVQISFLVLSFVLLTLLSLALLILIILAIKRLKKQVSFIFLM